MYTYTHTYIYYVYIYISYIHVDPMLHPPKVPTWDGLCRLYPAQAARRSSEAERAKQSQDKSRRFSVEWWG